MATKINYQIDQGSTFEAITKGVDNDGDPFDLTDYTLRGEIKNSYTSSVAATLSVSTTGSADLGVVSIGLAASQSAALPAGRYYYDIEITSGSYVRRWQEGQILVTPEVTKN